MPLYVTDKGQWSGSRAEAEATAKGGEVTAIDLPFPPTKADVLAFLNRLGAKPPHSALRLPLDPEGERYRVYCRGQFVGSTRAADERTACGNIASELVARPGGD